MEASQTIKTTMKMGEISKWKHQYGGKPNRAEINRKGEPCLKKTESTEKKVHEFLKRSVEKPKEKKCE